jgi:integrase
MRGVSVWERRLAGGTVFVARYTLPSGRRPAMPPCDTWEAAFEAASEEQRRVNRGRTRGSESGRMTFDELVTRHWLPTVTATSNNTVKNHASHLGDGTGTPNGPGAKAERAARFQLRNVFGSRPIADIDVQDVRVWQTDMVKAGYGHSTILAKRSLLRGILQVAVVNGWIDLNHVDAVPEPPKVQTTDEDWVITPDQWTLLRSRLAGETTLLLVDLLLDTGLRFGEATALRPCDFIDAADGDPEHVWVRRAVIWPGRRFSDGDEPWELKEYPKGRRWRRVAMSRAMYGRALAYFDAYGVAENALVFDYGRLRVEHAVRRERDPLPTRMPKGRYVNPKSGRSGAHGRYTTYNLGCRCPFCRNAYTEYRFWWARGRGRRAAQPWLEPGFIESRAGAVDPCPNQWFNQAVWKPAVRESGLDWEPTPHDLRHAMVTWSLDGGASNRVVQKEAGHASLRTTEGYAHRQTERVTDERVKAMARVYSQMPSDEAADASPPQNDTVAGEHALTELLSSVPPERLAELLVDAIRSNPKPGLRSVGT